MQRKRSIHTPKGMAKDVSDSKLGTEYYIDALNIRLTADTDNTLLSITNAKGNKKISLTGESVILGTYVGHAVLNNYIVLFTISSELNKKNCIYRIDTANNYKTILLAFGDFNFSSKYPIETLPMYEKEDVQKVYWIDGINQPRVINIADKVVSGETVERESVKDNEKSESTAFDFVSSLKLNETVDISRNETTMGTISAGTMQYVFTYYNLYGQETNIFHQSSLYYISYNNRGASPEDTNVSASFSIVLNNLDSNFEYVRIYAINRTSLDATPTVRRVVDLPVTVVNGKIQEVSFTDDGTKGELVDPSMLLYIGGKSVVPQTMEHKDGVLFFGNYKENGSLVPDDVKKACRYIAGEEDYTGLKVEFTNAIDNKHFDMGKDVGNYSYKSGLTENLSKISTFKNREYYRFGVQAQKATGEWSEPIFIGDWQNTIGIRYDGNNVSTVGAKAVLPEAVAKAFSAAGYKRIRPLIVYPTLTDRECICQGVLAPTVFNVEDRNTNSPWCQSSWFFRPNSSKITPGSTTVCYLPIKYDNDYLLKSIKNGDVVLVEYTIEGEDTIYTCKFSVIGIADNATPSASSSNKYAMLALLFADDIEKKSYLTLDPNAIKHALKLKDENDSIIGELLYQYDIDVNIGYIAIYSNASICNAIIPSAGSSAIMSWDSQYSYDDSKYNWKQTELLKECTFETTADKFSLSKAFTVTSESTADIIGTIPEFKHWKPLASAKHNNGEIQCNFVSKFNLQTQWIDEHYDDNFEEVVIGISPSSVGLDDRTSYIDQFSDMFFVDQSVVTFHSPDIEFDTNTRHIDESLLKMRIVGYVPITSTISDVDIQTSTIQLNYRNTATLPRGFWHETIGDKGVLGTGGLVAAPMWFDEEYYGNEEQTDKNTKQFTTAFITYPWHRSGSLNNQNSKDSDNYRSALLKRKVMSNLRYSYQTQFIDEAKNYDLSGIALFDSNEVLNTRIQGGIVNTFNYYGNVDKIVTSSRVSRLDANTQVTGYPIFTAGRFQAGSTLNGYQQAFSDFIVNKKCSAVIDHTSGDVSSVEKQQRFGSDPVQIKYKSTPHAVLSLAGSSTICNVLPTAKDVNGKTLNGVYGVSKPFWGNTEITVAQDILDVNMTYGWLWLAELYNPTVESRFGGTSDDAIENNIWVPCGQPIDVKKGNTLYWTEGDTYFQRYDCLKTYPFTTEDTNSVVDILSFMCETRVNIDGRYDRNRGQDSNLQMSPTNFNLLNHVYSQSNNFFNYRTLDKTLFNIDTYKNYITWSLKKTLGEEVDTWTNVTLANVMDLDGDKGDITALKRFNNSLLAFQTKALSQILYNEKTQVTTTAGVPIEIANSDKVDGKRYVSETIGCTNKWSIIETPSGLYFMDSNSGSIYLFNGKLESLTDKCGFSSWARNNINNEIWTTDFNTFRNFFDGVKKDVYFVNKDYALNYSETLGQFVSFINYENTPAMFNVGNKFYAFHQNKNMLTSIELYQQDAGDYGVFFGTCKPYYVTFVDNQDYTLDKVYTNLEFRAVVDSDMKEDLFNLPFDTLTANTDYQNGTANFTPQNSKNYSSYPSLRRKFRVWRADIPRYEFTNKAGFKKKERMRNPWVYLKLEKAASEDKQNKMEMHDLIVDYYI